jgi:hypothetical protein
VTAAGSAGEAVTPGPSEEAPVYAKVRQMGDDSTPSRNLWCITVDEGWKSSILCSDMYERDADFLLSVLGRTPRTVKP